MMAAVACFVAAMLTMAGGTLGSASGSVHALSCEVGGPCSQDDPGDATAFLQTDVQTRRSAPTAWALIQQKQFLGASATAMDSGSLPKQCGRATCDPLTMCNNNVRYHTHQADFFRPVNQVMKEHPGVDGYCYFHMSAMYIVYVGASHDYLREARASVLGLRALSPGMYRGDGRGQEVTYDWEGDAVTTNADLEHYLYDDLYAYSLGFLQGQGLDTSLMSNSTAWEALSAQQCEKIQQEYQFRDEELVLNDFLDANIPILAKSHCAAGVPFPPYMSSPAVAKRSGYVSPGNCKKVTKREYAHHHYMKCLMGYKNSASDMAYLHQRACLLDGNRIGHLSQCPYKW